MCVLSKIRIEKSELKKLRRTQIQNKLELIVKKAKGLFRKILNKNQKFK